MSLKDLIFQKGGIGVSLSRQETVERLNPLIQEHMALNHTYAYAINHTSEAEVSERLASFQKKARVDVGKLMETVLSAGGVAYNGVDMEPEDYTLNDDNLLFELRDREKAWQDRLNDELSEHNHQIRTKAVLTLLRDNSAERLDYLRGLTRARRRAR